MLLNGHGPKLSAFFVFGGPEAGVPSRYARCDEDKRWSSTWEAKARVPPCPNQDDKFMETGDKMPKCFSSNSLGDSYSFELCPAKGKENIQCRLFG